MNDHIVLPLALAIIGAVIAALMGNFVNSIPKKLAIIISWILIVVAIFIILSSLIQDLRPTNLSAAQTSIVATSTEIAYLIQNTQVAANSTQQANATQIVSTELARIEQSTATSIAVKTQIAEKVINNAGLCIYAFNPETLKTAVDSHKSILPPLIISAIAIIFFLILLIQMKEEGKSKYGFIIILALSFIAFVYLVIQYVTHPLYKLSDGVSGFQYEEISQTLLDECKLQQEISAAATQEFYVAQTQLSISQTETQSLAETLQAADASERATFTAVAAVTATQSWLSNHSFLDEFTEDINHWTGESDSVNARIDQGTLIFDTNKESRIAFWKCDNCLLPNDHNNYSFEVKYFAPEKAEDFYFGLLFGCEQFDERLVKCDAIQLFEQSNIIILETGTGGELYTNLYYPAFPNEKGLISVRWEVNNQFLKLWINNQPIISDLQLNGGGSGYFGFYADPPGATVFIERIEIFPLP